MKDERKTPPLLWPLAAVWRLLGAILGATSRIVAVALGFGLILLGILLTLTVVGAIVGIPLIVVGLVLVLRGLF
jgi:hypothetical protein